MASPSGHERIHALHKLELETFIISVHLDGTHVPDGVAVHSIKSMRKLVVILTATAAILSAGSLASNAQTTRGTLGIKAVTQNFTAIEKAACGPFVGRWCGPFHHRVCVGYRCWCAPC